MLMINIKLEAMKEKIKDILRHTDLKEWQIEDITKELLDLYNVVPSAFVMVIDDKEFVVLAENIADAMDKAEATGSKDYKMGFHKSFDVLH